MSGRHFRRLIVRYEEEGSAEHQRMRAVRTKMTIPPVMDD